jgi:hypothetical protein
MIALIVIVAFAIKLLGWLADLLGSDGTQTDDWREQ